jgi:hypothetical protein
MQRGCSGVETGSCCCRCGPPALPQPVPRCLLLRSAPLLVPQLLLHPHCPSLRATMAAALQDLCLRDAREPDRKDDGACGLLWPACFSFKGF